MWNVANFCFIGANHCWLIKAKTNKSQRKSFIIEIEFVWWGVQYVPPLFIFLYQIFDLAYANGIQIIFSILTA